MNTHAKHMLHAYYSSPSEEGNSSIGTTLFSPLGTCSKEERKKPNSESYYTTITTL
jgi:hypothetical protein